MYAWLGVDPPRGVLLHGPPGCGKTVLAHAIAHECRVPFLRVSAPEVVSGMSGESEAKLRSIFAEAAALAPCIVFIGALGSERYASTRLELASVLMLALPASLRTGGGERVERGERSQAAQHLR